LDLDQLKIQMQCSHNSQPINKNMINYAHRFLGEKASDVLLLMKAYINVSRFGWY